MDYTDVIILSFWALVLFIIFSAGWSCGYLWRRVWFKKAETEAVKSVRDYEAVKTENEGLRGVIDKKNKEIEQLERERKILEACNEDMVPHNCQCGKEKVIDDEIRMEPVAKSFKVDVSEAIEGAQKVTIFDMV
jgi:hypothetical protein